MWDECKCVVSWTFFGISLLWDWNKNWPFPSLWHCWVFQICWHIERSTFSASSFTVWNSSAGIPSPLLALFVVMLPKVHWLLIPGCLTLGEQSHHFGYLGHEDPFYIVLLVYSCHHFLIPFASVRSIWFLSFIVPIFAWNIPWLSLISWRDLCCCWAVAKSLQSCLTLCDPTDPTRLLCPWDSPGKNTGVGCHFLLQCMKVKSESEVAQSFPTLSDSVVCSLPGSSVHGIFQARTLEWGAIAFSVFPILLLSPISLLDH